MGRGIAQIAAQAGGRVKLFEAEEVPGGLALGDDVDGIGDGRRWRDRRHQHLDGAPAFLGLGTRMFADVAAMAW
jgi:hypothetical protein